MASIRSRIIASGRGASITAFAAIAALALVLISVAPAGAIETVARQVILVDLATGRVLFEKNADERMAPSSMSKIMTVYMIFESLKNGGLSLDDTFVVSEKAWRKGGSKMFVSVNSRVRVEDLLRGIIVQSGNDASIVAAEGLAGSEGAFADEINQKAKDIGLENSNFANASGWPDDEHYTTARDLSRLAQATIENFPEYYHYYAEKSFTYNGIRQSNRNPVLYRNIGADGLKTGHTEAAGFGLTASAERNGRRLILILNGLPNAKARSKESERLIDWGFREFKNYTLFKAGDRVTDANVWMGIKGKMPLVIENDLTVTLARKGRREMKVTVNFNGPLPAPITEGAPLASLRIVVPGREAIEIPLVAGASVERLGVFSRLGAALRFILLGQAG